MNKLSSERKKVSLILGILALIMSVVTVAIIVYGEVKHVADNWAGYIALLVIDLSLAIVIAVIAALTLPKINKKERQEQLKNNDFNILDLKGDVKNQFDAFHGEVFGVRFEKSQVVFLKVKYSNSGRPIVKNEEQVLAKRKVEMSDLIPEEVAVPYTNLKFYVVTNRLHWRAVPNIGIAIRLPKDVVASFHDKDEYVIVNACKELLFYVLGSGVTLYNNELLNEKPLETKPKPIKKFVFHKTKWWIKALLCLFSIATGVAIGVWLNPTIGIIYGVLLSISVLFKNKSIKIFLYDKYFGDGIRLCSLQEILYISLDKSPDGQNTFIVIATPVFSLGYPYNEELWSYLKVYFNHKILD